MTVLQSVPVGEARLLGISLRAVRAYARVLGRDAKAEGFLSPIWMLSEGSQSPNEFEARRIENLLQPEMIATKRKALLNLVVADCATGGSPSTLLRLNITRLRSFRRRTEFQGKSWVAPIPMQRFPLRGNLEEDWVASTTMKTIPWCMKRRGCEAHLRFAGETRNYSEDLILRLGWGRCRSFPC